MRWPNRRNPTAVMPDLLGLRLAGQPCGTVVWGVLGPGQVDPNTAEGRQRLTSPIAWNRDLVLFSDNLGLTRDPGVIDNTASFLLEQPQSFCRAVWTAPQTAMVASRLSR